MGLLVSKLFIKNNSTDGLNDTIQKARFETGVNQIRSKREVLSSVTLPITVL
jgi:hypothetical protein